MANRIKYSIPMFLTIDNRKALEYYHGKLTRLKIVRLVGRLGGIGIDELTERWKKIRDKARRENEQALRLALRADLNKRKAAKRKAKKKTTKKKATKKKATRKKATRKRKR